MKIISQCSSIETFSDYERLVSPLTVYPNVGNNLLYPTLGICGEAGEFAEKIKKLIRDDKSNLQEIPFENKILLAKELGDVLWYISAAGKELGFTLQDIAQLNAHKLLDRSDREKLHGNGDER